MEGKIVNYINAWLQVIISMCLIGFSLASLFHLLDPSSDSSFSYQSSLSSFIFLFFFTLLILEVCSPSSSRGSLTLSFYSSPSIKSLSPPTLSLPHFIALISVPIKFRDHNTNSCSSSNNQKGPKSPLNYAIKALILAAIIRSYQYKDHFHPKLLLTLCSVHIYLFLEIILAVFAAMGETLVGFELEPQFSEPYLSSSLQDFWSRRWNLMVTKILRPTVYEPAYTISVHIMGPNWAFLPAVFATFLVLGLVHEPMLYYLGRGRPMWEMIWFFNYPSWALFDSAPRLGYFTLSFSDAMEIKEGFRSTLQ